jgi:hypothetical protein
LTLARGGDRVGEIHVQQKLENMKIMLEPNEQQFLKELLERGGEITLHPDDDDFLKKWKKEFNFFEDIGLLEHLNPEAEGSWCRYGLTKIGQIASLDLQLQILQEPLIITISKAALNTGYRDDPRLHFIIANNKDIPSFTMLIPKMERMIANVDQWQHQKYECIRKLRSWFQHSAMNGKKVEDPIQVFFSSECTATESQFFLDTMKELKTLDLHTSGISWEEAISRKEELIEN